MVCFIFQQEYLQVELPYLADIRKIVTEGNVTSYTLRVSRDGQKFKDYKASGFIKHLVSISIKAVQLLMLIIQRIIAPTVYVHLKAYSFLFVMSYRVVTA